jgi:hypothetical protein
MAIVTYSDPTVDFLKTLDDPRLWVKVENAPIFKPHERTIKGPDGAEKKIVITEDDLEPIAQQINQLAADDGSLPIMTIGHRVQNDPNFKETNQPPWVGVVCNAKKGTFGPKNKPAITATLYYKRKHWEEAKEYPFRSIDFYPGSNKVSGVALLTRDPYLSMGIISYQSEDALTTPWTYHAPANDVPESHTSVRAPKEGIELGGHKFGPGHYIPPHYIAHATPEQYSMLTARPAVPAIKQTGSVQSHGLSTPKVSTQRAAKEIAAAGKAHMATHGANGPIHNDGGEEAEEYALTQRLKSGAAKFGKRTAAKAIHSTAGHAAIGAGVGALVGGAHSAIKGDSVGEGAAKGAIAGGAAGAASKQISKKFQKKRISIPAVMTSAAGKKPVKYGQGEKIGRTIGEIGGGIAGGVGGSLVTPVVGTAIGGAGGALAGGELGAELGKHFDKPVKMESGGESPVRAPAGGLDIDGCHFAANHYIPPKYVAMMTPEQHKLCGSDGEAAEYSLGSKMKNAAGAAALLAGTMGGIHSVQKATNPVRVGIQQANQHATQKRANSVQIAPPIPTRHEAGKKPAQYGAASSLIKGAVNLGKGALKSQTLRRAATDAAVQGGLDVGVKALGDQLSGQGIKHTLTDPATLHTGLLGAAAGGAAGAIDHKLNGGKTAVPAASNDSLGSAQLQGKRKPVAYVLKPHVMVDPGSGQLKMGYQNIYDGTICYDVQHAPAGAPTSLAGKTFKPGEFIPAADMAKATPQEKAALSQPKPAAGAMPQLGGGLPQLPKIPGAAPAPAGMPTMAAPGGEAGKMPAMPTAKPQAESPAPAAKPAAEAPKGAAPAKVEAPEADLSKTVTDFASTAPPELRKALTNHLNQTMAGKLGKFISGASPEQLEKIAADLAKKPVSDNGPSWGKLITGSVEDAGHVIGIGKGADKRSWWEKNAPKWLGGAVDKSYRANLEKYPAKKAASIAVIVGVLAGGFAAKHYIKKKIGVSIPTKGGTVGGVVGKGIDSVMPLIAHQSPENPLTLPASNRLRSPTSVVAYAMSMPGSTDASVPHSAEGHMADDSEDENERNEKPGDQSGETAGEERQVAEEDKEPEGYAQHCKCMEYAMQHHPRLYGVVQHYENAMAAEGANQEGDADQEAAQDDEAAASDCEAAADEEHQGEDDAELQRILGGGAKEMPEPEGDKPQGYGVEKLLPGGEQADTLGKSALGAGLGGLAGLGVGSVLGHPGAGAAVGAGLGGLAGKKVMSQGDQVPATYAAAVNNAFEQVITELRSVKGEVGQLKQRDAAKSKTIETLSRERDEAKTVALMYQLRNTGVKAIGQPGSKEEKAVYDLLLAMDEPSRTAEVTRMLAYYEKDASTPYTNAGAPTGPMLGSGFVSQAAVTANSKPKTLPPHKLDEALKYMRKTGKEFDECAQYVMDGGSVN